MSDPWADMRDIPVYVQRMAMLLERYESRGRGRGLYQVFPRVQELLADADALLGLKEFVEIVKTWAEEHDELSDSDERDWLHEALLRDQVISDWLHLANMRLAALPESLKKETE